MSHFPSPASAPREVRVWRGLVLESCHQVHAAVHDGTRLLAGFGDAHRRTFYRSASKPFQATPLVRSGAADRFGLTREELAMACASHTGTPRHTQLVAGMLRKGGLVPGQLQCGSHPPYDPASWASMQREGITPNELHENCSGKHAGMLLRCLHEGWPLETYLHPGHPHQRDILGVIAGYAGEDPAGVTVGVDGCSAPVFAVPLSGMARSWARFAAGLGPGGQACATAVRLRDAMRMEPFLVGGPGRLDTDLMTAAAGEYVVKIGAEAVYCVGHLPSGRGLALKVEDGNARAIGPALHDLLTELGWPVPAGLEAHFQPVITTERGARAGRIGPEP